MYIFFYHAPFGKYALVGNNSHLTHLLFETAPIPKDVVVKETAIMKEAHLQLEEYFTGKRTSFDLPFDLGKDCFFKKVWGSLLTIPYGKTASYKEIAKTVGSPKAFRAVGNASKKNPLPIFYPCHRIIGSRGKLLGYAGGIATKEYLVHLEKNCLNEVRN